MKSWLLSLILFVMLFTSSCQKNVDNNNNDGNDTIPTRGLPPAAIVDVDGGSIGIDGLFAFYIGSGTLSDSVSFSVTRIAAQAPSDSYLTVGSAVRVLPSGTVFISPATVIFRFVPESLMVNLNTLTIFTNSGSGWYALPTTTDPEAGLAYACVAHLSDFVLAGKPRARSGVKANVRISRDIFNHCYHYPGLPPCDSDYVRTDVVTSVFLEESLCVTAIGGVQQYNVYMGHYDFNEDTMSFDTLSDSYYYADSFVIGLDSTYNFAVAGNDVSDPFNQSLNFPADEPHLVYAGFGDTLLLSGDTLKWFTNGTGGTVLIEVYDSLSEDTLHMPLRFYAPNTGRYWLSAALLRGVYCGQHVVSIKNRVSEPITERGYTGDSFIELYSVSYALLFFKNPDDPSCGAYSR